MPHKTYEKHVRFARVNILRTISPSPISPLPPLTHESYSPASSSSLPTPPDFTAPLPSMKRHKLSQPPSSLSLHPLLEASSNPEIIYDVRHPPSALGARTRPISPGELNEPATYPYVPSITIVHKYLPWSIHVAGSGYSRSTRMHMVTVWDVLKAIHSSLRMNISQSEYDRVGKGSKYQERVRKAYESRYRSIRDRAAYQEEKMGGVRRTDFLVEYVKFVGLAPYNLEKGEFELHTRS